jgi:hypothetical protein
MRGFLKAFTTGPGAILIVVTVAWYIYMESTAGTIGLVQTEYSKSIFG